MKDNSYDEKSVQNSKAVIEAGEVVDLNEDREVFKKTSDGVDFRTVGWVRASVIFLKGMRCPMISIH